MDKPAHPPESALPPSSSSGTDSGTEVRARPERRTAVLVVGMHRSGTSAITRVINLLGADLSANLMPAVKDNNEAGFWESADASELNEEILASAFSSWDDWRRFDPGWHRSADSEHFRARAIEILARDFAGSSLFVLKDPRICRVLPFWLDVLPAFDADPKIVLSVRNPIEVAASLNKRDGFHPAKSLRLWLRHVLDSELETRGLGRSLVTYDALLGDWRRTVKRLTVELGVDWPRDLSAVEGEIDGFLEPRHRHHVTKDIEVPGEPEVAAWVKGAYSALDALQADPESPEALEVLDRIRAGFDRETGAAPAAGGAEGPDRPTGFEPDGRVGELTAQLAADKKEKEELRRMVNQLAHRLNEIQMSATWQLSRPVFAAEIRWPVLVSGISALPKLVWWTLTLRLRARLRMRRQAKELLASGLFDLRWYVEQNPDVVLSGKNPVIHWLDAGCRENRNPNPWFDVARYLEQHPGLSESGVNPLTHYARTEAEASRLEDGESG